MKKLFGLGALMLSLTVPGALAADTIDVRLGNSHVIGPVEHMATVIIGHDGIAGATLGGGGTIILTGKMLGSTNIIVLDESGRELLSSDLVVVPLDNRVRTTVRILRGASAAQTYICEEGAGCAPGAAVASVAPAQDEDDAPSQETSPEEPVIDAPDSEEIISLNP